MSESDSAIQHPACQNPDCEENGTKTYRDNRGNSVKVCPRHHYELVTGDTTITYTRRNRESDPQGLGGLFR